MMKKLITAINDAESILIFAGAGMSADSGLTTYQDKEGFYNDYPLYKELNKNYVSVMSYQGLLDDPYFAWGYYAHQYKLYCKAKPHKGYLDLLKLCQSKEDYFVVTTNVDGLFVEAGFARDKVHEVHGSIHNLQCSIPCHRSVWRTEGSNVEIDYATMKVLDKLPRCPKCGFISRPNICMYGDTDDSYVWKAASENTKQFKAWRKKNKHKKVLIFEIGVGAEGLKRHTRKYHEVFNNVTLVRVNPEHEHIEYNHILNIHMGAKETFESFIKIKCLQ